MTQHAPAAISAWNLANALTVLRLLLVPVFVVALLREDGDDPAWRVVACVVFAVATLTDRVDGEIARRRGQETDFGRIADPIADKWLTGAALVGLSILDELAWWVTALVLVREIGITCLRFYVIRHGVIPASRGGKLKTVLQGVAIGLYLLPLTGLAATLAAVVMGAAVVVTLATGLDYVVRALTLRKTSERAAMKRRRKAEQGS